MIYQPTSYSVFLDDDGENIYFNEETLEIYEFPYDYLALLQEFTGGETKEGVLVKSSITNAEEIIDELIEMKIIKEKVPEKIQEKIFNIHPQVSAFRIVLTETCNLACVECFVTKNRKKLKTMSMQTLEKVINLTIPYGKERVIKYHFFGGEPLICFEHIKRAVVITEEAVKQCEMIQPRYTITTNATLITDEIIQFFKEHNFEVGVSVDGPLYINDKLRVYHDGSGTFVDIFRAYNKMWKAGIDLHVLITPHPNYLSDLPLIVEKVLEDFPMKRVTINTPFCYDTLEWSVNGALFAKVLVQAAVMARAFGVEIDSALTPLLASLSSEVKRQSSCSLQGDEVMTSVDTQGNISFCSQKWHQNLSVSLKSRADLTIPIKKSEACLTCEARNICGGPCPAFQKISGKELDANKCAFTKVMLREIACNLFLFEDK